MSLLAGPETLDNFPLGGDATLRIKAMHLPRPTPRLSKPSQKKIAGGKGPEARRKETKRGKPWSTRSLATCCVSWKEGKKLSRARQKGPGRDDGLRRGGGGGGRGGGGVSEEGLYRILRPGE